MFMRSFVAFLISLFTCGIAYPQEFSPTLLHQPTLTPQNSGTTNGLIAVSPVNPQVVWASGRNGTFTVTTDGGETWRRRRRTLVLKLCNFAMCKPSARALRI